MKGMIIVPVADVRPDEPRWWCEDGEVPELLQRVGVCPRDLHLESREDCASEGVAYAIVVREVAPAVSP